MLNKIRVKVIVTLFFREIKCVWFIAYNEIHFMFKLVKVIAKIPSKLNQFHNKYTFRGKTEPFQRVNKKVAIER